MDRLPTAGTGRERSADRLFAAGRAVASPEEFVPGPYEGAA
ncbi:hypothetical protein [Streptomyces typhae]|nr:hypothetical protein [Streptomyces typhae]